MFIYNTSHFLTIVTLIGMGFFSFMVCVGWLHNELDKTDIKWLSIVYGIIIGLMLSFVVVDRVVSNYDEVATDKKNTIEDLAERGICIDKIISILDDNFVSEREYFELEQEVRAYKGNSQNRKIMEKALSH